MNRKFIIPRTPAHARLLSQMSQESDLSVDAPIVELALEDRVSEEEMTKRGIVSPTDQDAVQFIHDMGFRCGLPCQPVVEEFDRANKIVRAALEIAGLDEIVSISPHLVRIPISTRPITNDITVMTKYRDKPLVIDVTDDSDLTLASKFFQRVVTLGRMRTQLAFSFGGEKCTTTRMSNILNPGCQYTVEKTKKLNPNLNKMLLATGIFPYLLDNN